MPRFPYESIPSNKIHDRNARMYSALPGLPSPGPFSGGLIFTPKPYPVVIPAKAGIQTFVVQASRLPPIPKGWNMNCREWTTPGTVPMKNDPLGVEEYSIQPLRGWFIFPPTVGYRLRLFTFIPSGDENPRYKQDLETDQSGGEGKGYWYRPRAGGRAWQDTRPAALPFPGEGRNPHALSTLKVPGYNGLHPRPRREWKRPPDDPIPGDP